MSITGVRCQEVSGEKGLLALVAFKGSGFWAPPASGPNSSEVSTHVGQQLLLSPEALSAVLTGVLFIRKVGAQVVLHCKLIGVSVVTNRTVVFARFMRVSVVDQTSRVAVCSSALVTGKRPRVSSVL